MYGETQTYSYVHFKFPETEDRVSKPMCPKTTEFKKRAQSLLVVVSSEPSREYGDFTNKVRKYNSLPPFNFSDVFAKQFNKVSIVISRNY